MHSDFFFKETIQIEESQPQFLSDFAEGKKGKMTIEKMVLNSAPKIVGKKQMLSTKSNNKYYSISTKSLNNRETKGKEQDIHEKVLYLDFE